MRESENLVLLFGDDFLWYRSAGDFFNFHDKLLKTKVLFKINIRCYSFEGRGYF